MTFIMTNVVSNDEIKELQNLFAKLDTDKDGKLSQQELFQGRACLTEVSSRYTHT